MDRDLLQNSPGLAAFPIPKLMQHLKLVAKVAHYGGLHPLKLQGTGVSDIVQGFQVVSEPSLGFSAFESLRLLQYYLEEQAMGLILEKQEV
jgi:hypothetical protein